MELRIIRSKIYELRGQKVMLDFDLAELYQVETKYLKRAVRNHKQRFPDDFMIELTKDEYDSLRCNFSTLKNGRGEHSKYLPFAFTELGVAMLSSVLNSELSIEINISIMRAFVAVRQMLSTPLPNRLDLLSEEIVRLKEYVEEVFANFNDINEDTRVQLELINQTLAEMQVKRSNYSRRPIGFMTEERREALMKEYKEKNKI